MKPTFPATDRTTISRLAKRGSYDEATIHAILDEALVGHVSYVLDGRPFLIPTGYCRIGGTLYLHGSVGSHFFRALAQGVEVCVCVTMLDGLVLARSAFHHSVNYRSVVAFGTTRLVSDETEKWTALERFTEHMVPGRWAEVRQPDRSEMQKTMVVAVPIAEASAKIRTGGVNDDPEDADWPVWAGVLPLHLAPGTPEPDAALRPGIGTPPHVSDYQRF